jgi:hypothetical protein
MSVKVKIKVTLRLTSSQSVSLGVEHPPGAYDQIFITVWQLRSSVLWTPLTTGRVCLLCMLLVLASTVFLGSKSLGAWDHILLSQIWDFPFCHLLRLAGSWWNVWYVQRPYIGVMWTGYQTPFLTVQFSHVLRLLPRKCIIPAGSTICCLGNAIPWRILVTCLVSQWTFHLQGNEFVAQGIPRQWPVWDFIAAEITRYNIYIHTHTHTHKKIWYCRGNNMKIHNTPFGSIKVVRHTKN